MQVGQEQSKVWIFGLVLESLSAVRRKANKGSSDEPNYHLQDFENTKEEEFIIINDKELERHGSFSSPSQRPSAGTLTFVHIFTEIASEVTRA